MFSNEHWVKALGKKAPSVFTPPCFAKLINQCSFDEPRNQHLCLINSETMKIKPDFGGNQIRHVCWN